MYGWFKPGTHDLWRPGEKVFVNSPRAMLNQELSLRTVTFTQDNESGTQTTLDFVAPCQLNDESAGGSGTGAVPTDPNNPAA